MAKVWEEVREEVEEEIQTRIYSVGLKFTHRLQRPVILLKFRFGKFFFISNDPLENLA